MSKLLTKPWFLATLALTILLGTQAGAFYLYWAEILPEQKDVLVVKREDPEAIRWSFSSENLLELRSELEQRISQVETKENDLSAYEARLKADRAEIEGIKAEVERMRETLTDEILKVEEWEHKNLKTLADTYSELEPDAAVAIFEELDDMTVAKILRSMKSDVVGDILQEMAAGNNGNEALIKRAAKLSDLLRLFTEE
ncbi:MAG: hypothetical protein CBD18_07900 [Opitutales bacterium TMED158]|nr:MAG: hypothetical protein CBD18_07900 [Opitutales bacterium TMED158]